MPISPLDQEYLRQALARPGDRQPGSNLATVSRGRSCSTAGHALSHLSEQNALAGNLGGPSSFGGTEIPAPEPLGRRAAIRSAAVSALLLSLAYLIWCAMFTVNLEVWWLSVPVVLLEIHAFASLALFAFSLGDPGVRSGGLSPARLLLPATHLEPRV